MHKSTLKDIAFGCMILLMPVLVIATFIERIYGNRFVVGNIYHSPLFIALWGVLAISGMIYILRTSRRYTLISLHASLVMVLAGAAVSFCTSKRGEMTLLKDSVPASMFTTPDDRFEKLPFRLELSQIDTCYINGTETACDYKAHISISNRKNEKKRFTASLNKPIRANGYSLCIKSISENGLSLFVSYDPWGVPISYAGYLMTFLSFVMLLFDKKSGFNSMLANRRLRVTYKGILISACIAILVLFRITTFTGDDAQPILRTPLLSLHISTIIVAYSLLGCCAINAIVALCNRKEDTLARRAVFGRILLYPATLLLMTGIFIGAIWANVSWGRYWGWDPKEVWALITLLVCSITFHTRSLPFISKARTFHIYCIVLFLIMLFTYFGVNYLLSGLHSYA